jgi:hypothetical protein
VRDRRAKQREDAVAQRLRNVAAVAMHRRHHYHAPYANPRCDFAGWCWATIDQLGDASLQSLKRLIIEKTEGNPFFMEETSRQHSGPPADRGASGCNRRGCPIRDGTRAGS